MYSDKSRLSSLFFTGTLPPKKCFSPFGAQGLRLVCCDDLADVHGVIIAVGVPPFDVLCDHVVRADKGFARLAADEDQLCLLEGRLTLDHDRRQAALVHLIHVAAGLRAEQVERVAAAVLQNGQREKLGIVDKGLGVAGLADVAGRARLAPHHADAAPACGHGVPLFRRAGGNQHPVLADQLERIEGLLCDIDLLHDKTLHR